MTVQSRSALPCVLAVFACFWAAPACSNTTNPGFADDGGGASGSSGAHSGSSSGSGGGGSGASSSGSASSGSGGGGSGASSSGSASSGAGSSGGSSGASSGTGGSGSVDAGVACGAPTTGGIPLTGNAYASSGPTGVPGMGGYAYAYADSTPPALGTSTACVDATAFCGTVATGMVSASTWGGGIGVNLNQQGGGSAVGMFAATGTGIKYALSGLAPQGMRILIDNVTPTNSYCANQTAASGTIPWSAFNTTCWQPDGGSGLSGPPTMATHINFQVNATASPGTFSFCVTSLAFAP